MRYVLGILSGLLGMLAGWFGLAFLIVSLAGPDRDGGTAMGAFFNIGPIGGIAGFVAGFWLFWKFGLVRQSAAPPDTATQGAVLSATEPPVAPPVSRTRVSRPVAVAVLLIAGGIAFWAWYELIRSPYLTHGFMALDLQFRLPSGMSLPPDADAIHILVDERHGYAEGLLGAAWHGHDGDRAVILATALLSYKSRGRTVTLSMPGVPDEIWPLDLSYDPDPTPGFSAWQPPGTTSGTKIEMNFRLRADR
jgi:hypothetical protein